VAVTEYALVTVSSKLDDPPTTEARKSTWSPSDAFIVPTYKASPSTAPPDPSGVVSVNVNGTSLQVTPPSVDIDKVASSIVGTVDAIVRPTCMTILCPAEPWLPASRPSNSNQTWNKGSTRLPSKADSEAHCHLVVTVDDTAQSGLVDVVV
jgi:hypothetical protein